MFSIQIFTFFSVDSRGNELMLLTQQDDFQGSCCSYMGGLDELFWCSHLRRLVNIGTVNVRTSFDFGLLGFVPFPNTDGNPNLRLFYLKNL